MKYFIFCLLLGGALGSLKSIRENYHPRSHRYARATNAPGNCDPKKIPRPKNFKANTLTGSVFRALITPQQLFPIESFANLNMTVNVKTYRRPDWTEEQYLSINGPVDNAFKFEEIDSSVFSTVMFRDGVVFTINDYAFAQDDSTGTAAFYFEVLRDGEYDDSLSHILIRVRDPCLPVDLSGISDALVEFCGKEALKDGFFETVPHKCPGPCYSH